MLALLSALMYHQTGVVEAKLATTGDIVTNTQTSDIRTVVEDIRAGVRKKTALANLRLRFGRVADGFEGLSPSARTNAPFSIRKEN
jgi:tetrahydromethanopterin S-methyltransferase subunit F